MRPWFRWALVSLAVAAVMGLALRVMYLVELPIAFRSWMHGHSHGAMLGWLFPALLVLATETFALDARRRVWLSRLLLVNLVAVVGMFIWFPIQGYGAVSSSFATLQVAVSLGVLLLLGRAGALRPGPGVRWFYAALGFLLVSLLGLAGVGYAVATGQKVSELFILSVQWFLHFQFNGWFFFAVVGLWLQHLHQRGVELPSLSTPFKLWLASAVGTYALAIVWTDRSSWVYALNAASVLLQLSAGVITWQRLWPLRGAVASRVSPLAGRLMRAAVLALALKVIIQTGVAIPEVAVMAFTIRNYVVGFIHLIVLGLLTLGLWALAIEQGLLSAGSARVCWGVGSFAVGVLLTELLLLGQGTLFWAGVAALPGYYTLVMAASVLLVAGAALVAMCPAQPPTAASKG